MRAELEHLTHEECDREFVRGADGSSPAACSHDRSREVGQTMEGMGAVIVRWCPACGALKRTMTNWRYEDWPWELPSANHSIRDRCVASTRIVN